MKFIYARPKVGDTRIVKKFLLFPYTIYGEDTDETRWLETAYIKQESTLNEEWRDVKFVDNLNL
jgi:hypothetical protein